MDDLLTLLRSRRRRSPNVRGDSWLVTPWRALSEPRGRYTQAHSHDAIKSVRRISAATTRLA